MSGFWLCDSIGRLFWSNLLSRNLTVINLKRIQSHFRIWSLPKEISIRVVIAKGGWTSWRSIWIHHSAKRFSMFSLHFGLRAWHVTSLRFSSDKIWTKVNFIGLLGEFPCLHEVRIWIGPLMLSFKYMAIPHSCWFKWFLRVIWAQVLILRRSSLHMLRAVDNNILLFLL